MKRSREYRIYEIIPGALSWAILAASFIVSFLKPLWAIYFIILFDFYWLVRVSYFVLYLIISWRRFYAEQKKDWFAILQKDFPDRWRQYTHLVFIPTYKEPFSVVEGTLAALEKASYDQKRLWVIVGLEERDPDHIQKRRQIENRFSNSFFRLTVTVHTLQPDELAGKSANAYHMAHVAKGIIDKEQGDYDTYIVSNFDSDTQVHPQYFAYLTHAFLSHPNPYRTSFQPIAVYNNNLWRAPSLTRVVANSTTFWLMTELSRPEQMFTFSSHSMSWRALVDVGFWDRTIVTEDSRIFIQCFLRYKGEYSIQPLYIPVSMDTVEGETFWRTVRNQYRQILRWAYSVEHFPYMMYHFRRMREIPFQKRFHLLFKLFEGVVSWATAPLLILVLGRLPLFIAGSVQNPHVIVQNAPFVLEWLMRFAMIGIFASAVFNVLLIPHHEFKKDKWRPFILVAQWFLLPITMIAFGSAPALHAQTRLMLGKYMGFWNTEKIRKPSV